MYGNIVGNEPVFFPQTKNRIQDLHDLGKNGVEIAGEINHWQEFQRESLDDMISSSSIDELIEFYDVEAREFYDVLPGVSLGYVQIGVELRMRRIKNKHCE